VEAGPFGLPFVAAAFGSTTSIMSFCSADSKTGSFEA
jgi:hypothetical protein